ncbi:MAG: hypothetical protein E7087_00930 [Bacteroidales bacterium]|nr:hypothetical protein [Bacteroidales bacterium]
MGYSKHKIQVVYLYISTILGSLLGFVTSIVNTNFISDSDYGDVRYVQNLITLFASLLLFGYFLSGSRLLAVSNDKKYSSRVRGAMVVVLAICSIILICTTLISALLHKESGTMSLFIISLPVCMYPLFTNYINTTAQGDNHIGRLAISRVLPASLYVPIAYLLYSNVSVTSSLMILLQWGVYCIVLLFVILSTRPAFNNLKSVFLDLKVENESYGKHLYYGSLLMVATNYLAGVTLGIFNDDNVNVGYYTLALTLTAPLAYLPGIIGTAYFKKFVNEPRIPINVLKGTLIITLLSCLCFIVFIKFVVELFYPASYMPVGGYAAWMAVGFSVHGIGDMINRFLGSHGEGVSIRNSSYACGIFKITGFVFLVWLWDINGALLTNILSSFVYCASLLYYYIKYIKLEYK